MGIQTLNTYKYICDYCGLATTELKVAMERTKLPNKWHYLHITKGNETNYVITDIWCGKCSDGAKYYKGE